MPALLCTSVSPGGGIFTAVGPDRDVQISPRDYMDDVAFPVEATFPHELPSKLEVKASVLVGFVRFNGFEVNFNAAKTEAIVACHGAETWATKDLLASFEQTIGGGPPAPYSLLSGCGYLRMAAQYKHLGVWQATSFALDRDLAGRTVASQATCSALSRSCLAKSELPEHGPAWCPALSTRREHGRSSAEKQFARVSAAFHKPCTIV